MDATALLELIDRYLKDELTGKELALFEAKIQKEPALLREVELQRQAILAIKEVEIRNVLRKTRAKIKKEEKAGTPLTKPINILAAPDHLSLKLALVKIQMFAPAKELTPVKINPACISVAYEGDPTPPFQITSSSGNNLFTRVIICPDSGTQTFHYQLIYPENNRPILYLYGNFNPAELTLIYRKQENQEVLKLRVNTKEYFLRKNELVRPLSEQELAE